MNMDIIVRDQSGMDFKRSLPDGAVVDCVTDEDMRMIYDAICDRLPLNCTVFKTFNARKNEWIVEVCDSARDYKTKPIWTGIFKRA